MGWPRAQICKRTDLIARRVTENPRLQPAALSCRGHHAMTFTCCGLVSSKETSEKFLSVGRERKERGSVPSMWPWVTAQLLGCVAQAVLLGTGLITPGITAGDRSPSPRPITQNADNRTTASKMARRWPLFRGDKRPFLQNQPLLCNKHECPHR